ncbi:taurine catabolism dioxygenase [Fusarium napiforme]|uniref:Taurine catabolism dioxygenase n=1 Tax=Fusarium napiforme TaxID=42672 RepID=A0A8H5IC97_9HYPO|nr:taurine catabolism dioxygenase [Fusarium napiforme]
MDKDINQSSFPLPNLGKTLLKIRDDVYHGRGFATLRGFNVDQLSPADVTTAYLGLTSYIAERRGKQNQQGTMMINVVNTGKDVERDNAQVLMPFHTDLVCDTLSMLTLSSGPVGGCGVISSAWTVYNELAESRPDLIDVLAQPNWPFDTHGREPPYYRRALLYWEDEKLITNYSRRILVGESIEPRTPGIPGLTEAQAEAIDALHAIGRRHELQQSMHQDLRLAWERVFNDLERQEEWHFVQYSPTGEQHVIPVWSKPGGDGKGPSPPQPPPPVNRCD